MNVKKMMFAAVTCGAVALCGAEVIPSGDNAGDLKRNLRLDAAVNTAKLSLLSQDKRNVAKVDFLKYGTDTKGLIRYSITLYAGGSVDFPLNGFPVEPNSVYRYSVELRGQAKRVYFNVLELRSKDFWTNRERLKLTGKNLLPVSAEWVTHKGEFTTGDKAMRVVFAINLYGAEEYKTLPEKPGDYFCVANLKLEKVK